MNSTPFDPGLVQVLVILAETLSFSKTATRLGVTKGTISRKIARLEEQVGSELVRRNSHHVTLTSAGRAFYDRAREPLRELLAIVTDLPSEKAPLSGEIRITAPPDLGVVALPVVLERFLLLHPNVTFALRLTNDALDLVEANVDLALRIAVGKLPDSSLVARRIGSVDLGFYAAPSYLARRGKPRALYDHGHEWITFRPSARGPLKASRALEPVSGASRLPLSRVHTDDCFLVLELARRGLGIGSMPTFFAEPHERDGSLERVLSNTKTALPTATVYLLTPSRRKLPRQVQAFREHLIQSFKGQNVGREG